MQPNPTAANRANLVNPPRSKFYDPSEPYRALLAPPKNQNPEDPTMSYAVPPTNIDLKTGAPKQIPQFYYPRYDDYDYDDPSITRPNFVRPQPVPSALPVVQQPVPPVVHPYSQPVALPTNPYGAGQYYPYGTPYSTPYGTPYLIPMTTNVPQNEPAPALQERSKSDVIAAHQQDADLSRLEIYHFTPKQDGPSSKGTSLAQASQPIIQYHVYPYPPGTGAAPPVPQPLPPPPQQYPSYPQPWSTNPPNGPPYQPNGSHYVPEPPPPSLPLAETKARSSQTEQPPTKNRAVSPMYVNPTIPYDEDGHPYVNHKKTHTDRHYIPTGKIDRRFYDINRSSPLSDCRCLDCQRERSKVLNYYPD
jgi:hypothetical protein